MQEGKAFIDTNILIYAYNKTYPDKRRIAQEKIDEYETVISTQVINEFCNTSLYKLKKASGEVVAAIQEIKKNHSVIPVHLSTILDAMMLQGRYQFNYYDCVMLASALANDCKVILSEDMQHRQIIENKLRILNPFKTL